MLSTSTHNSMTLLADYCRTGIYKPVSGVNQDNIHHYRRLVFNNILDSVTAAYPLARKLLKKKAWNQLVNRFFASHKVQHPQIWMMPGEFKDFILQNEAAILEQYYCLSNLLELEWAEVEVFMMPDIAIEREEVPGYYYLNPEIKLLKTEYPVHLKKASEINDEDKGLYFVSLHRNPHTGAVQFTNLTLPYVAILEHLNQEVLTKEDIIKILTHYVDMETAESAANLFLEQSVQNQLIFT